MKKILTALLLFKSSLGFAQEKFNEIVKPEIYFLEDFSSNTKNWPLVVNDSVGFKIVNGVYNTMAAKTNIVLPKKISTSLSNKRNLWRLSAEVTYVDGTSFFGLLFGSFDSQTMYTYMINGGGNFVIVQTKGKETTVLKQGKSSKINIGKGAVNIISIETDNNDLYNYADIRFYVNGSNVEASTKAEAEKNVDKPVEFTMKEIDAMQKDMVLHSIDPENFGDGKIGIIVTRGAAANFDNIKLETKPNKGRMIMYKNKWGYDPYFSKYLAKDIAADDQSARSEVINRKIKKSEEDLNKAKVAITRLSKKLLQPYGNAVAAAKPDEKAVAWLYDFVINLEGVVGGPLYAYPEKDLISKTDSTETYAVRHYLPGVITPGKVLINSKKNKSTCLIPLAKGLSTAEATTLSSNYLATIAAALGVNDNEYYEPVNKPVSTDIPRSLCINGSKSFISNRYVAAILDVKKDTDGTWGITMNLFGL
ncbi:MAG: hypothetical protein ACQUYJ_12380 [Ferruginibacter sp.]